MDQLGVFPNPWYGEAHPTELHLSMDQLGVCPNLT